MASWMNIRKGTTAVDISSIANEFPTRMARAWIDSSLVPGYVRQSNNLGYFVHEGQVVAKKEFQIFLDGNKLGWLECEQGEPLPFEALQVGRTAQNEPLFIGRVEVEGAVMYGKVQRNVCYVATNKGVIERTSFLVLAVMDSNLTATRENLL